MEQSWSREKLEYNGRITAKCYLKLGEWYSQMILNTVPSKSDITSSFGRGQIATPIGVNYSNISNHQMTALGNSNSNYSTTFNQSFSQSNYQR